MAETQVVREASNSEKITQLAKDVGVPESYVRAVLAKKRTRQVLQIGTYADCKRVFTELKDTPFAVVIADLFDDFIGKADLERIREVADLISQADNQNVLPPKTDNNSRCQRIALESEKVIDIELAKMMIGYENDGWTVKHILTSTKKYSEIFQKALKALATLREIKPI